MEILQNPFAPSVAKWATLRATGLPSQRIVMGHHRPASETPFNPLLHRLFLDHGIIFYF